MARNNPSLTMEDSINPSADILRLESAHNALNNPFGQWDPQDAGMRTGSSLNMSVNVDMGLGISGGNMNTFQSDVKYQMDTSQLDNTNFLPFTPSYDLDAFTTFDDPFSYNNEPYTFPQPVLETEVATTSTNTTSKEEKPDNKLLSFKPPISTYALLTSNGQQTWPSMTAELNGMFFVAEDVFGEPAQPPGRPTELTCYRRNLFQISGNIIINRDIKNFVTGTGVQIPIYNLAATLSAVDSTEGKPTEIISVPWKPANHLSQTPTMDEKFCSTPQKIPLDLAAYPELDPMVVSLPVSWKRLQFKHATANNGRRKGLQQNYVVQICLTGVLGNGEEIKLMEVHSGPVIVRGRSPRNFDARKDVAVSASKPGSKAIPAEVAKDVQVKEDPGVSNGNEKSDGQSAVKSLDISDWKTSKSSTVAVTSPSLRTSDLHKSKKPTLAHNHPSPILQRPPVPNTKRKSNSGSTQPIHTDKRPSISDLSILGGSSQRNRTGSHNVPRNLSLGDYTPTTKRRESSGPRSGSFDDPKTAERKLVGSPLENADLLYEYFPLTLDDWMPPVDAIYRPHVVHHTIIPPDLKAELVRSKTKRYFSAED